MQIVVCADDGDEITVNVDELAAEQRVIRLELHNFMFGDIGDYEAITLTIDRARELASAILTIADTFSVEEPSEGKQFPIESIKPDNVINWTSTR